MICKKCGVQLAEGVKFCSECGEPVVMEDIIDVTEDSYELPEDESIMSSEDFPPETTTALVASQPESNSQGDAKGADSEKINWKDFLTLENIERFAPIAALLPIVMFVVMNVMGIVLGHTIGIFPLGYSLYKLILFLLRALFVIAAGAATGGLVYIAVNKKDVSQVSTWIAPFGTFMAFVACLGQAFHWRTIPWVFGIVAVVLGIEFLARIVIANKPMDSQVDFGAASNTYQQYYRDYRSKYPTTSDLEKAGIADIEESKFDGSGAELFCNMLLASVVCMITCGIAAPWMICWIYKWRIEHTVINGKRLTFNGSGGSLLGNWILWEILTIVTCGIYSFFLYVALRKWELSHTYIADEPIYANGTGSRFDGDSFTYFAYGLLSSLLLTVTCGLAFPWVMAMIQKWDTSHQIINNRRLAFSGSGLGFLGEFLIIFFFSIITCGLYMPWGIVRMNKYIIRHTDFVY